MAQNVNVNIGGWRATGINVTTPQYEVAIKIEWTDNAGKAQTRTELVLFPNILAQVPAEWAKEEMTDLMLRALRRKHNVDRSSGTEQIGE